MAVASATPATARAAAREPSLGDTITHVVQPEVARGFSGVVLVAKGDAATIKAFGAERGETVRTHTRFWIASVGKQFTSAAILKCAERGLLQLSDPMAKYFPAAPKDKRPITIEHLLAHLSGLQQSYVSEGLPDRQVAVERMLNETLIAAPGAEFHYSNSNYQLAVAIVEIVSGKPYRSFVRDELWKPAGLADTGFSAEPGARLVAPARGATPARLSPIEWGGEGVYSTADDLFRWYRALRSGSVLSAASVQRLFTAVAPIQEGSTALGWFIGRTERNQPMLFTRGNEDFGANALVYAYPESDMVIIVLTHSGDANADHSWSRFILAKLQAILAL